MSLKRIPNIRVSETLYETPHFRVRKDALDCDYDYYILEAAPVVIQILAKTKDDLYVINREYRHPTGEILLSCPGGLMQEKEEILACAQRELLEETGYRASHWEPIGTSYPIPGISGQKTLYFRALHAIKIQEPALDEAEFLETVLLSAEELKKRIGEGEPVDGLLCSALFFDTLPL